MQIFHKMFTIANCTEKEEMTWRWQPVPGYSAGFAPQVEQKQGWVGLDIQVQTPGVRELSEEQSRRKKSTLDFNTKNTITDQVSCVKSKHRSKPLCMWGVYSSPSLSILNSALLTCLSHQSSQLDLSYEVVTSLTKYLTLINLIRVCTSGTIASAGTRRT